MHPRDKSFKLKGIVHHGDVDRFFIDFAVLTKSEVKNMDKNTKTIDEKELKIIEKLKTLVEKEPEDEKEKKREKIDSV